VQNKPAAKARNENTRTDCPSIASIAEDIQNLPLRTIPASNIPANRVASPVRGLFR
jgi:hypothetical protein